MEVCGSFFLQPFPRDPLFPTGYLQLHPHDFFMWPSCRISLDLCYMPQNTRAEGAAGVPRHATFQDGRCTAPLVTWEDLRWSWAMDPEDFFYWSTLSSYCCIQTSQKTSNDWLLVSSDTLLQFSDSSICIWFDLKHLLYLLASFFLVLYICNSLRITCQVNS